ncbi:hypothetical protein Taro_023173 [Colocasia esculenta]|uniref:Uncharacterized protein n=1 Tax=Colocasia esculenta TaxID=4460 RepID=A0A843V5P1_COLES|nr:hypothetical protein [Colocasia esculenta]
MACTIFVEVIAVSACKVATWVSMIFSSNRNLPRPVLLPPWASRRPWLDLLQVPLPGPPCGEREKKR